MTSLSPHDLQWILLRTPKKLLALMKDNAGLVFMAGGFIRACIAKEEVSDIDLFVPSYNQARALANELVPKKNLDDEENKKIYETENAFTVRGFGLPIQVIHRWTFDKPEQCIASFDFTIAQSAIWWDAETDGWKSLCAESFYADLAAKRLVYTMPVRNEDAGGSMLRVLKFYQKGYRIPLSSLGSVMARMIGAIPQVNWEKKETMPAKDWEQQVGHVMTGLLREVDPALDPKHLAHLPDLKD